MVKIKKTTVNIIVWIAIGLISLMVFLGWLVSNLPKNPNSINIPSIVHQENTGLFLLYQNNCNFEITGDYKHIDIATPNNRIYTESKPNYLNYTKKIEISGHIDNVWLCVIADVSDKSDSYNAYRKKNSYYGMVYVYFDKDNYGYINVSYYKSGGQFYDADTDSTHALSSLFDGQFWSSEAPKKFLLSLDNVIVADKQNGWYKKITPINLFQDGAILNVGGFMASLGRAYWASSISDYRLIYRGTGTISIK